ncbi:MAG: hypothetical protein KF901_14045 [Myxococcales bacterium]|nr:hypothetical protein [Myxococcales bacterium]
MRAPACRRPAPPSSPLAKNRPAAPAAAFAPYASTLAATLGLPDPARAKRRSPTSSSPRVIATTHLALSIERVVGAPVDVVVTQNRRMMVSARREADALVVRVHEMFLLAPAPVVDALGRYLKDRRKEDAAILDTFIASRRELITKPKVRRTVLRTRGAHHDLREIFEALEPRFVESFEGVQITWGRLTRRKRGQRGLQLGTYSPSERLIRIHPILDQAWVPGFVVATVVHHEMLHHALPAVMDNGRAYFHTPEFRRREAAYPDHARCEAWERANIGNLLRSMPR